MVSRHFHIQIASEADLEKIKFPEITFDPEATERSFETLSDIFDGISSRRSYHGASSFAATLDLMSSMLGSALDRECFTALVRVVEQLDHAATPTMRVAA